MQQSRKFTPTAGPGKQAVWQVMQYEGLLGKLQDAIQESDAPEAQKILQVSHVAYNQFKDSGAAGALLQAGQYDAAYRGHVCEKFVGQFCKPDVTDTADALGHDNLMSYDPFYGVNASVKVAPPQQVQSQPPRRTIPVMPKLPAPCFQDALNNKHLCRMNTTDASDVKPLKHFLRRDSPQELRSVLTLRGGGLLDGCYGSCGTNPYGTGARRSQRKLTDRLKDESKSPRDAKAHERVKHSMAARVNAFLDEPVVSFTLISIDLFSDLINIVLPWVWWFWIGLVALCLVVLQQTLEIYLHSCLVDKEILIEDEVVAVISFWADNGENHPVRIEAGQTGVVNGMEAADWRDDSGALITFGDDTLCFVSELDFEDLEVTSGLYEYFANPMNTFNVLILALVFVTTVGLLPTNGAGAFLIILRFLKPTLRLYSRKNKMAEFHEKASGEEGGEEA